MKNFIYSRNGKGVLLMMQLLLFVATAGILIYSFFHFLIPITFSYGSYVASEYYLNVMDKNVIYEDSELFNSLLQDNVYEAIRYAALRDQMETKGEFDGTKIIGIRRYAEEMGITSETGSADDASDYTAEETAVFQEKETVGSDVYYYLGALIKWGQYGKEYRKEIRYIRDIEEELGSSTFYTGEEVERVINKVTADTPGQPVKQDDGATVEESGEEAVIYYEIIEDVLIERYKTVEGYSLRNYVKIMPYRDLEFCLAGLIDLFTSNYREYKQMKEYYQNEKSNLFYCITFMDEEYGTEMVYTNLTNNRWMENQIKSMGKYIVYSAADMTYETNTDMTESDLFQMTSAYSYQYTGNYKIWIGLDTSYETQDAFALGYKHFNRIIPWIPFLTLLTIAGIFLVLVLLVMLSTVAGKDREAAEVKLLWFDYLYTEFAFICAAGICGGILYVTFRLTREFWLYDFGIGRLLSISVGGVFLFQIMFLFFFLSLIRRCKKRTIWRNSLLQHMLIFFVHIFKEIRKFAFRLYDNGITALTSWVTYMIFVMGNVIMISFGSPRLLMIAVGIDLAVGIFIYRGNVARKKIVKGIEIIREGDFAYKVDIEGMHGESLILAESVNTLGDGIHKAVETSMKDERLKADLITNVSHDIKTPLTSIINYVDLLKRENIENDKVRGYIEILDSKSQRLKHLTEDLVEASKISSGNIELIIEKINLIELLHQSLGEFMEQFAAKGLQVVTRIPDNSMIIEADSRRTWRIVENLFSNVKKYTLENTRVYVDVIKKEEQGKRYAELSIKNISANPLNIDASELTERFIRGDISRGTEGSGLGLTIAKDLTEMQHGKFVLFSDGDLFKVTLTFAIAEESC